MTKLNLVLESVRDEFLVNSLEESDSEVTILKRKHFLNENINFMKKIIIEENVLGKAKNTLNNSWAGRHPVATGAAIGTGTAAGAAGLFSLMSPETTSDTFSSGSSNSVSNIKDTNNIVSSIKDTNNSVSSIKDTNNSVSSIKDTNNIVSSIKDTNNIVSNIKDTHTPVDKKPTLFYGFPQLSVEDKFAMARQFQTHGFNAEYDYENDVFRYDRPGNKVIKPEIYNTMFQRYHEIDEDKRNNYLEQVKEDRKNFLVPELSDIKKPTMLTLTPDEKINIIKHHHKNYIYDHSNDVIKYRYSKEKEYQEIPPSELRQLFHKYQEDNGITKYDKREKDFFY